MAITVVFLMLLALTVQGNVRKDASFIKSLPFSYSLYYALLFYQIPRNTSFSISFLASDVEQCGEPGIKIQFVFFLLSPEYSPFKYRLIDVKSPSLLSMNLEFSLLCNRCFRSRISLSKCKIDSVGVRSCHIIAFSLFLLQ